MLILFSGFGKTNKQSFLKKLKVVKKVKISLDCQQLCADFSGCTHFVWKNNRKVAKRTWTLQNIGYKTKKNFVSGPVSCWTDKLLIYLIDQVTSVQKQNTWQYFLMSLNKSHLQFKSQKIFRMVRKYLLKEMKVKFAKFWKQIQTMENTQWCYWAKIFQKQ